MIMSSGEAFIPFHVEIRFRGRRDNDLGEHELEFAVLGASERAAVIVASDMYQQPIVVSRVSRGGLKLDDALFDSIALKCFKLMASVLSEHDGSSGSWRIPDVTNLIRNQMTESEADAVLNELIPHVGSSMPVDSICVVADDNSI
jgi:hypothetical protein